MECLEIFAHQNSHKKMLDNKKTIFSWLHLSIKLVRLNNMRKIVFNLLHHCGDTSFASTTEEAIATTLLTRKSSIKKTTKTPLSKTLPLIKFAHTSWRKLKVNKSFFGNDFNKCCFWSCRNIVFSNWWLWHIQMFLYISILKSFVGLVEQKLEKLYYKTFNIY